MATKISSRLSMFASDDDNFSSPFTDVTQRVTSSDFENLSKKSDEREDRYVGRKKPKKDIFDKLNEQGEKIRQSLYDDDNSIAAFDAYFSEYADDEEDLELKQSLLSKGRKYARETKLSPETSEIVKTFSHTEKLINELLDDISNDITNTQRDINDMRAARIGRNNKALVDMQINKTTLYNTKLSAVKELNSMKKNIIELQNKANKEKAMADVSGDSDGLINRAIGSLLGNRDTALGTVGGYESVSGARGVDSDYASSTKSVQMDDYDDDDEPELEYDSSDEGRNYLKYEGRGVELVVTEHEDGSHTVTAEDRDGIVIDDYPLPTNANNLVFNINERYNTATDDFHRKYKYRRDY